MSNTHIQDTNFTIGPSSIPPLDPGRAAVLIQALHTLEAVTEVVRSLSKDCGVCIDSTAIKIYQDGAYE